MPNIRGDPLAGFLLFWAAFSPDLCFWGGFSQKPHCHLIIRSPQSIWQPRVRHPEEAAPETVLWEPLHGISKRGAPSMLSCWRRGLDNVSEIRTVMEGCDDWRERACRTCSSTGWGEWQSLNLQSWSVLRWVVKKSGFGTQTQTFYGGMRGTPKVSQVSTMQTDLKDQAIVPVLQLPACINFIQKNQMKFHFCIPNFASFRDFGTRISCSWQSIITYHLEWESWVCSITYCCVGLRTTHLRIRDQNQYQIYEQDKCMAK